MRSHQPSSAPISTISFRLLSGCIGAAARFTMKSIRLESTSSDRDTNGREIRICEMPRSVSGASGAVHQQKAEPLRSYAESGRLMPEVLGARGRDQSGFNAADAKHKGKSASTREQAQRDGRALEVERRMSSSSSRARVTAESEQRAKEKAGHQRSLRSSVLSGAASPSPAVPSPSARRSRRRRAGWPESWPRSAGTDAEL